MSAIDDLLSQIPLDQLASQLGTDPATAESAARKALPALLGGLQANAQDPGGAASLSEALGQHGSLLDGSGVNLDQVDPAEGEKIVGHIFGDNTDAVATQLGGLGTPSAGAGGNPSALSSPMTKKLLSILAPIVLAYVAKQVQAKMGGSTTPGGAGGGILGGILGQILGGTAGGGQAPPGGGNVLQEVLGGLFGGGRRL